MKDVAARARVDVSVVSRLLNDDSRLRIAPATRARVLDAVHALDYRPNLAARGLRTSRAGLIAFVMPRFSDATYARIVEGAHRRAINAGYAIVLGEFEPDLASLLRGYRARGIDGVLLAGGTLDDAVLHDLTRRDVPLVVVNRQVPELRCVATIDYHEASEIAAEHLLALGHRSIAVVAGPADFERSTAFAAAVRRGAQVRTRTVRAEDVTGHGGLRAGRRLLARSPLPTAVFATTQMLAIGILRAAHEAGIRVPEDLSVVAIHDSELAEFAWPPLTTVAMPMAELGAAAFDHLVEILGGADPEPSVVAVAPTLVVRGSSGPVRRTGCENGAD